MLLVLLTQLVCVGEECCYGARLTNIDSLKVNGKNAASFAVIVDVLEMEIEGTNESPFSVYCIENTTCKINCQSKNACDQMLIFCDGLCYVSCNENKGT